MAIAMSSTGVCDWIPGLRVINSCYSKESMEIIPEFVDFLEYIIHKGINGIMKNVFMKIQRT